MEAEIFTEHIEVNSVAAESETEEIDVISDPTPLDVVANFSLNEEITNNKTRTNETDIGVNVEIRQAASNVINDGGSVDNKNTMVGVPDVNVLDKVQFTSVDDGEPDETDVYKRFYFESDHLALKENADYRLLLQTLVALEAQRKQAIKDYEKLIRLQKDALAEPIKFVEKLQNNEWLDIPSRQSIIKLPHINWEAYSGVEDFSHFGLLHQHNTRHASGSNVNLIEKANQRWEEQSTTSNGSLGEPCSYESMSRFSSCSDNSRYVRGKLATSDKPLTFNQPWTVEEQRKLERLLQLYPQEPIESKRWLKIAKALGNRTPKQVASRVQKYFIKLAKSGLPIPGREPNLNRLKACRYRNTQQQAVSLRNSTFFPSYKPRVYMDDNEKSDAVSMASSDDLDDISDDESIPKELRNTKEYFEIMQLKKLKKKRAEKKMQNKDAIEHIGYTCILCGISPITGVRWHCIECPDENMVNFCNSCVNRQNDCRFDVHSIWHKMESIECAEYIDGDYVKLGETSHGYNYLDPNFLPCGS
ncbi:ZZ-type zinc finger-containing protein 3-like isoform X2 [Xenia sp. Carnegie-2017]|uniref:ZZ-type zinc finger-containing protein 3-like isoform X2 n=1 Tax=Xenia sp. Carnegie-2017 TaxID=2897299 RepID=UPI001F042264|nr:ZZ-type zinc finger-containing protein 3-like isoform X2 [Xenia sp. Carnegie-2017]